VWDQLDLLNDFSIDLIDSPNKKVLLDLPDNVILLILAYLPSPDLCRVRCVNRRLCALEETVVHPINNFQNLIISVLQDGIDGMVKVQYRRSSTSSSIWGSLLKELHHFLKFISHRNVSFIVVAANFPNAWSKYELTHEVI
ncbi:hypothetical protein PFISCL1PPCAC_5216, partial [Pristionchus fissidentatus]